MGIFVLDQLQLPKSEDISVLGLEIPDRDGVLVEAKSEALAILQWVLESGGEVCSTNGLVFCMSPRFDSSSSSAPDQSQSSGEVLTLYIYIYYLLYMANYVWNTGGIFHVHQY